MFYFISVKAVTYSGLKTEKDKASLLAYIFWYFVPYSTNVAVFDILRYDILT